MNFSWRRHNNEGFDNLAPAQSVKAFILVVLPARLDPTQCREQSQARLSYAEAQGDGRSKLATVPLEVGCSDPLSYGSIHWYFRQESNLRCPKTGDFFAMRLKELQSPAIAAMRHPSVGESRKIPFRQSPCVRHNPSKLGFCSHLWRFRIFGAFREARPLSRGLGSFSESGKPITTAHPYFLLFDTAKLDSPDAAYLRSKKNLQKKFAPIKRRLFWAPQK